jgi:hypothetical protein
MRTQCKPGWFRALHSTTLQCMRLTDHVTLDFNNNIFVTAVFLDIEKAFDRTWHIGLLYKLKLKFLISPIKPSISFLRKFRLVEGEMSTSRDIQLGVPQGSDNVVESQYPCSHVLAYRDSKLLSGFPEGLTLYNVAC